MESLGFFFFLVFMSHNGKLTLSRLALRLYEKKGLFIPKDDKTYVDKRHAHSEKPKKERQQQQNTPKTQPRV